MAEDFSNRYLAFRQLSMSYNSNIQEILQGLLTKSLNNRQVEKLAEISGAILSKLNEIGMEAKIAAKNNSTDLLDLLEVRLREYKREFYLEDVFLFTFGHEVRGGFLSSAIAVYKSKFHRFLYAITEKVTSEELECIESSADEVKEILQTLQEKSEIIENNLLSDLYSLKNLRAILKSYHQIEESFETTLDAFYKQILWLPARDYDNAQKHFTEILPVDDRCLFIESVLKAQTAIIRESLLRQLTDMKNKHVLAFDYSQHATLQEILRMNLKDRIWYSQQPELAEYCRELSDEDSDDSIVAAFMMEDMDLTAILLEYLRQDIYHSMLEQPVHSLDYFKIIIAEVVKAYQLWYRRDLIISDSLTDISEKFFGLRQLWNFRCLRASILKRLYNFSYSLRKCIFQRNESTTFGSVYSNNKEKPKKPLDYFGTDDSLLSRRRLFSEITIAQVEEESSDNDESDNKEESIESLTLEPAPAIAARDEALHEYTEELKSLLSKMKQESLVQRKLITPANLLKSPPIIRIPIGYLTKNPMSVRRYYDIEGKEHMTYSSKKEFVTKYLTQFREAAKLGMGTPLDFTTVAEESNEESNEEFVDKTRYQDLEEFEPLKIYPLLLQQPWLRPYPLRQQEANASPIDWSLIRKDILGSVPELTPGLYFHDQKKRLTYSDSETDEQLIPGFCCPNPKKKLTFSDSSVEEDEN